MEGTGRIGRPLFVNLLLVKNLCPVVALQSELVIKVFMLARFIRRFSASVDPAEMERFSRVAQEWWNPDGPYAMLLRMNPVRVGYIRNTIPNTNPQFPFKDLKILDIGCGGGFLSQSLRRLGAQVTAVDANYENVQVAKAYDKSGIEFIHGTAEDLVEQDLKFDAVCGLEIVEHVTNPKEFVKTCSEICKVPRIHLAWWSSVLFYH
jgi:2-polyprenyl-6-hydroxyphenyl methylase/3-demethylubiquinone-9 3-methyltransferase